MPVTGWNRVTKDGRDWLVVDLAQLHVPLDWDPSSNMFLAIAAPSAGFSTALANFPALVQGDPGPSATIEGVDFTALAYDDPTPNFAEMNLVAPATELTGPVYRLNLALHMGPPGQDGTTSIDLDSIGGDPSFKKLIQVNSSADGFEFVSPKVGDRYLPASLLSTSSGNANATIGLVAIEPQDFDWRPDVRGQCVITPTGTNIRVDLRARLNGELGGNIVARGFGISGVTQNIWLDGMPPAGVDDGFDKVLAGEAATVHLRVERTAGSDTFTTAASTSSLGVRVQPVK